MDLAQALRLLLASILRPTIRRLTMKTSIRTISATLAVIATVAGLFVAAPVQAKSAHCSAVPVPGQPGHFIVVCSRVRP
jgi:hypothetical protein